MKLHIFEARTANVEYGNWGKFAVGIMERAEWERESLLPPDTELPFSHLGPPLLLKSIGWTPRHFIVFDLQTGEGGLFLHGGHAAADLNKHQIWVCPLFEAFLAWTYEQDLSTIEDWPGLVELDAHVELFGYRRPGPHPYPYWYDKQYRQLLVLSGPGTCMLGFR